MIYGIEFGWGRWSRGGRHVLCNLGLQRNRVVSQQGFSLVTRGFDINVVGVRSGIEGALVVVGGEGARGKRMAAVEEVPVDRTMQQKQRRMIKNKESAASSREQKQVLRGITEMYIWVYRQKVTPIHLRKLIDWRAYINDSSSWQQYSRSSVVKRIPLDFLKDEKFGRQQIITLGLSRGRFCTSCPGRHSRATDS